MRRTHITRGGALRMPATFDVCLQNTKLSVFPAKDRALARERPPQERAEPEARAEPRRAWRTTRVCQATAGVALGAAFAATHPDSTALAVVLGVLVALACGAADGDALLRAVLIGTSALAVVVTPAVLPPDRCPLLLLVALLLYDVYVYMFMSGKTLVSNLVFACAFISVLAWLLASYIMEWNALQAAGNDVLTLVVLLALSAPNIY